MAWKLLPVDYTDAIWNGLKRYNMITNEDNTVSLQDVTVYTNREKSFFGARDANRMNEALNTIMSMLENGTDLYEAFRNYFAAQKELFEGKAGKEYDDFVAYVENLEKQGDKIIEGIKTDYRTEITGFESQQEQIFNAWFMAMKNQLSQDAAGSLQNQCTELDERLSLLEYMALQNDFSVPVTTDDETLTLLTDDFDNAILTDWKYKEV